MKLKSYLLSKTSYILSAAMIFVAVSSLDVPCWFLFGQPKMPDKLRLYKK